MNFKRWRTALLLLSLAWILAAADLPQFSLTDTSGRVHTHAEWGDKRAVVLLFVSTDCPLSNGYVPELNRIERAYAPRGIAFYAVQGGGALPPQFFNVLNTGIGQMQFTAAVSTLSTGSSLDQGQISVFPGTGTSDASFSALTSSASQISPCTKR